MLFCLPFFSTLVCLLYFPHVSEGFIPGSSALYRHTHVLSAVSSESNDKSVQGGTSSKKTLKQLQPKNVPTGELTKVLSDVPKRGNWIEQALDRQESDLFWKGVVLCIAITWATNFPVIKVMYDAAPTLDPSLYSAIRFGGAGLLFAPILPRLAVLEREDAIEVTPIPKPGSVPLVLVLLLSFTLH